MAPRDFTQEVVAAANVVGPKSNGQEAPVPRPLSVVSRHGFWSVGPGEVFAKFEVPNEVDEEPYVEEDDEA